MGRRKRCKGDDDAVSSPFPTKETISTKRRRRRKLTKTLTSSPSLPILPFDLVSEILCRLQVKLLLQLRCVCKSWNSLISDSNFAKKHNRTSAPTRLVHTLTDRVTISDRVIYDSYEFKYVLKSYTFESVLTNKNIKATELDLPGANRAFFVGSCNGILCLLAIVYGGDWNVRLCNPSIRKFKDLPPLEELSTSNINKLTMYGFGHDTVSDNYKIVIGGARDIRCNLVSETDVKVYTSGTNFWKNIQKFPIDCVVVQETGKFVSGTMNWLVSKDYARKNQYFVVSLDLRNESYQEVLLPDYGEVDARSLNLSVFRDCLCMIFGCDVWIMKEYGKKESWHKLFIISHMQDPRTPWLYIKAVHIFEDGQLLLKSSTFGNTTMFFQNSRNDTFEFPFYSLYKIPEVCFESLISPCS
ncbi:putative F-box domain, galactose oxidase/kelch, beta-propeller, F-box associated interaction [Medicago truncatula]|uniref:F-box protein interaction domain protein n=1 Tax=Medicago truncatula TaxID=3880 RepID=G7J0A9_MEDTR|nr:F-box/kelch-repeat protein At3g23880 [Medicago truncatula]AES68352.1 F-box protein interaction domain protein [Medicago truncatula]RHN65298.1 putative F-box domain, galactose oxidase/kelch, beta-propeller, F-box associated interaction [Medicago truncatula]